jgi:hypothetical protein
MNSRRTETLIAWFTLAALAIYVPGETYVSWPRLTSPYYVVDLIAMALLLWGSVHSLRARPACSPGILCAAYGWAAANGWRSTLARFDRIHERGELHYGIAEVWVVGIATAIALALFVLLLALTAINPQAPRAHMSTMTSNPP